MTTDNAQSLSCAVGMTAHTSQAGGGSIGAKESDVSSGHSVCPRDVHGSTVPETPDQSPPKTEREFERALRGLGFSKRQAREIAARGFKAAGETKPLDETDELSALIERIKRLFDER